jgi:hypothetical protein
MEYLKNGVAGSIMTANEARRNLDLSDADGGDILLANGNIVPLTQAGAAYGKAPEDEKDNDETEENKEGQEDTAGEGLENDDPERTGSKKKRTKKQWEEVNNSGEEKAF